MAIVPFDGSANAVPVGPGMTFRPSAVARGWVGPAADPTMPGVLGGEEAVSHQMPAGMDELWEPVAAPIELEMEAAPTPGVLGGEEHADGLLEFQPADEAVYLAMQEIHCADGMIFYDFTRPMALAPSAGEPGVLGDASAGLQFPIRTLATPGGSSGATDQSGVLGIENLIGGVAGEFVARRVVQLVRAPIERSILNALRQAEGQPQALLPLDDLKPLQGFEAWRSRVAGKPEPRVLLLIHGFTASGPTTFGGPRSAWVRSLGQGYDLVVAYSHPTISQDVLTNAQDLLAMIPEDLRLQTDVVCHSRGGLLGRALVELLPSEKLHVRRAVFNGSPHAGTMLASPERWDTLVSLLLNGATLAATALGGGAALVVTRVLGYILKAAAQFATDLPGAVSMRPGGEFLTQLNSAGDPALAEKVRYATVVSRYSIFNPGSRTFAETLQALAAQAFLDVPNDIIVPTDSMSAIDPPQRTLLGERVFRTGVSHFGYFDDPQVQAYIAEQLR